MLENKKTILMTGSTGFIGKSLRKYLEIHEYKVFAIVRNLQHVHSEKDYYCELTNDSGLRSIFEIIRPDFVLALAGRSQPDRDVNGFTQHYQDTILPALHVARTASKSVKMVLFFGSCEEYGNGPTPFCETQAPIAFSPYGWAKISAYYATQLTCKERGVPFCWLRPFLVFGSGQSAKQLVPSVISACLKNQSLDLTPGEQTRDFIYIEDLNEMILRVLRNYERANSQVINLGSGVPRTIKEVTTKIQRMIGRGSIKFGGLSYRSFEAMSFYASMDKYRRLFGPFSCTEFDEALMKTIEGTLKSFRVNSLQLEDCH